LERRHSRPGISCCQFPSHSPSCSANRFDVTAAGLSMSPSLPRAILVAVHL
jgi:hypothetical protein